MMPSKKLIATAYGTHTPKWEKTDHVGVHHVIETTEPFPSGHLYLVSNVGGTKISSRHHSMEDAREQVGRNSSFLARIAAKTLAGISAYLGKESEITRLNQTESLL